MTNCKLSLRNSHFTGKQADRLTNIHSNVDSVRLFLFLQKLRLNVHWFVYLPAVKIVIPQNLIMMSTAVTQLPKSSILSVEDKPLFFRYSNFCIIRISCHKCHFNMNVDNDILHTYQKIYVCVIPRLCT